MAIEQASFTLIRSDPPYEIRSYEPLLVAAVSVEGTRSDAVSDGFKILAGYIFGSNVEKTKIAMTAPVMQLGSSADVASVAPSDVGAASVWVVRFMMPGRYTLKTLPMANDNRIHFEQSPARRVAAIRFSGFWSDANFATHEVQLRHWMMTQHLNAVLPPIFAYYDPPWTPWFMRRVEILIDVDPNRS